MEKACKSCKEKMQLQCDCEVCKNGVEATVKKGDLMLDKHGWFVHYVSGDESCPFGMNAHTHGLAETQDHLDLQMCIGINPQHAHSIFTDAIEGHIKKGFKYEAGKRYDDLIEPAPAYKGPKYEVLVLEATENDRPVLRFIFPEKDGSFEGQLTHTQMEGCIIPEGFNLKVSK